MSFNKETKIISFTLVFSLSAFILLPISSAYSKTDISGNTITTENIYTNQIESYFDSSPCGSNQAVKRVYSNGSYVCGYSSSSLSTVLSIGNSAGSNNLDMSQQDITNLRNLFFNSGTAYFVQNSDGDPIKIQGDDSGGTRKDLLSLNPDGDNLTLHGNDLDSIGNVTVSGDMGITGGNIGIGMNSPSQKLDVSGRLTLRAVSSQLNIMETDQSDKAWKVEVGDGNLKLTESGVAVPFTIEAGAGNDALYIDNGSNVGIGTDTPNSKLEIVESGLSTGSNTRLARFRGSDGSGNAWLQIESDDSSDAGVLLGNPTDGWEGRVHWDDSTQTLDLYAGRNENLVIESGGNVGIGTSSPGSRLDIEGGNLDMSGNAINNVDWGSSDSPFVWAALDLENGDYYTSDGDSDSGLSPPSSGSTSCTNNGKACVYNSGGSFYQIGLKIPDSATYVSWGGDSNHMCWPVSLGDPDPNLGGDAWDSGIDKFSNDNAGSHMGHCVNGAPDNGYRVSCMITVGTDYGSNTHYGIVCMK